MEWDTELYNDRHSFVAEYGKAILTFVNRDKGQKILDLGCGTGILTHELAQHGATVIGTDVSPAMIDTATTHYPDLTFRVEDARNLPFDNEFDTVFSNAVFHWIPGQEKLLGAIHRSLKDQGMLICEFGAKNNIAHIQAAFAQAAGQYGYRYSSPFFLPSTEEYGLLLEQAGFSVRRIVEYARPTPLADGERGLRHWLCQFFASDLLTFSAADKEPILSETERLCRDSIWNNGQWVADYRRIQVIAVKQTGDLQ